jgi:hypothetical protein
LFRGRHFEDVIILLEETLAVNTALFCGALHGAHVLISRFDDSSATGTRDVVVLESDGLSWLRRWAQQ